MHYIFDFLRLSREKKFEKQAHLLGLAKTNQISKANTAAQGKLFYNEMLIKAARNGNIDEIDFFLKAGANVNAVDSKGYTALMVAGLRGRANMVETLLDAGAKKALEAGAIAAQKG